MLTERERIHKVELLASLLQRRLTGLEHHLRLLCAEYRLWKHISDEADLAKLIDEIEAHLDALHAPMPK